MKKNRRKIGIKNIECSSLAAAINIGCDFPETETEAAFYTESSVEVDRGRKLLLSERTSATLALRSRAVGAQRRTLRQVLA